MHLSALLTTSLLLAPALTKSIPPNLQKFYNTHKSDLCDTHVAGPFKTYYGASHRRDMYWTTTSTTPSVLFLKHAGGGYADMDIDCDGAHPGGGRCGNDPSGQAITAFQYDVAHYHAGIHDLDAHVHPYVVLGNTGADPVFHPQSVGIRPLSVVAVVCNGQLHYGVWGDVNGGVVTGEASLAMGQLCFGETAVSGNNGHEGHDVLYIAFPGKEAVPGAEGAKWDAGSKEEFERSIEALGDRLVAQL